MNQGWNTVDQGWRTVPTKKTKFGPKVGSHCWWLQQAREEPIPYQVPYSAYQLGRFKALAEYEYSVLGKGIVEGAPDWYKQQEYPLKIQHKPFYFEDKVGDLDWESFQTWTWLTAVKEARLPIGAEASVWVDIHSKESNRVKAVQFLARFRKENIKPFDILLEAEYEQVPPGTDTIDSIEFKVPQGKWYPPLNTCIKDNRYIPTTYSGSRIRKDFIAAYLEDRLAEYLALGGIKEVIVRYRLPAGYLLPDLFFWDLWGNLDHLRQTYSEFCAKAYIDPEKDQESIKKLDLESETSWDTQ